MGEILGKKVHRKLSFFSVKRIDRLSKLFPRKSSQTIERFITEKDIAAFFLQFLFIIQTQTNKCSRKNRNLSD